jgi:hypothetical protein
MYKKSELQLKNKGYVDLAAAVVRQWARDSKPASDLNGVKLWAQIIKMAAPNYRKK